MSTSTTMTDHANSGSRGDCSPTTCGSLTLAQRRLWTLTQIGDHLPIEDACLRLRLTGPYDLCRLAAVLGTLARIHPVLRTRYALSAGGRVDCTLHPWTPDLGQALCDQAQRHPTQSDPAQSDPTLGTPPTPPPFTIGDLTRNGPCRISLHHDPVTSTMTLTLRIHPIALDTTALAQLSADLAALLSDPALASEQPSEPTPDTPPGSPEQSFWPEQSIRLDRGEQERRHVLGQAGRAALAHWRSVLDGRDSPAALPGRPVPVAVPGGTRARRTLALSPGFGRCVDQLAMALKCPVPDIFAAAFSVVLARYGNPWSHVVGVVDAFRPPEPSGHRPADDDRREDILPLPVHLNPDEDFVHAVTALRSAQATARAHHIPFERLAQDLWDDQGDGQGSAPGADLHALYHHHAGTDWSLAMDRLRTEQITLNVQESGLNRHECDAVLTTRPAPDGGYEACLDVNEDTVDPDLAERMLTHWNRMISFVCTAPDHAVGTVPLLTPDDLDHLSAPYPDTAPRDQRPVHQRISLWAQTDPDGPAILCGDTVMSRGELDTLSNRWAHALLDHGLGAEDCVAVFMKRSPRTIAAILAVLKAGAAFVPVDPDHPDSRNHHILRDANVRAVMTNADGLAHLPPNLHPSDTLQTADTLHPQGPLILDIDRLDVGSYPDLVPDVAITDGQLAYVIYTSGSTGAPKGVAVDHGPLARHLDSTAQCYEMDHRSRELPVLPFSSDGGHERWMVPLMVGGSIVLPHAPLLAPDEALALMHRHGVTNASLPTSYVHQLAEWADLTGNPPPARLYSFGGEAMAPSTFALITRALKADTLINGYGPTETIMTPMVWKVPAGTTFDALHVPIGRPVGDRRAYILDARGMPVPPGVVGELYLGGDGVARGYVGLPEMTADRFVADPFSDRPGARLYKTGDLARWHADGMIDFIGRADQQVKLRGYRIELGEIESVLKRQAAVREAVVILRNDHGVPALVAYVVAAEGQSARPDQIRTEAARTLPDYMVPTAVVVLPHIPLTANSKLDRKALPAPSETRRSLDPPRSAMERLVCEIWADCLGLDSVGIHENFFHLGGSSIIGLQILSRLKRQLGDHPLAIVDLFNNQTVADLAAFLEGGEASAGEIITLRATGSRPMLYCFPGLLVSTREYLKLLDYLGPDQPATGFVCYTLCEDNKQAASITDIAARYADHIRTRSAGQPVFFLGWSWGGTLAYETARLLGDDVDVRMIGMVDVCDMDTDFALGAIPRFAPGDRERMHAEVQDWLGKTRMQAEWHSVIGAMDELAYDQFLSFVLNSEETLPLDGPALGSREHIFWVLIDNALIFRQHTLIPHDVPICSFAADDSLHRGLNLIDWRGLSPSALPAEVISGTTHLHIIGMSAFHARFAQHLDRVLEASDLLPKASAAE